MSVECLKPEVTYTVSVNGKTIEMEENVTVSYISPYNKVYINIKPKNTSLSYFEARATEDGTDWDVGVGTLLCHSTSISSTGIDTYFDINSTNFPHDGSYRISLYSKNDSDGTWDITYLLFVLDSETSTTSSQVITQDTGNTGIEMLTTRNIPD